MLKLDLDYGQKVQHRVQFAAAAAEQKFHLLYLLFSSEAITTNDSSHFISFLDFWKLAHHILQRGGVHVKEFMKMLMISSNFQMIVTTNHSFGWDKFTTDQVEKGGLSSSIGTDQSESGIKIHSKFKILVNVFSFLIVSETDILKHKIHF